MMCTCRVKPVKRFNKKNKDCDKLYKSEMMFIHCIIANETNIDIMWI